MRHPHDFEKHQRLYPARGNPLAPQVVTGEDNPSHSLFLFPNVTFPRIVVSHVLAYNLATQPHH